MIIGTTDVKMARKMTAPTGEFSGTSVSTDRRSGEERLLYELEAFRSRQPQCFIVNIKHTTGKESRC